MLLLFIGKGMHMDSSDWNRLIWNCVAYTKWSLVYSRICFKCNIRFFLLLGTIKQKKLAIIIYLVLGMAQIIEMLIFTIMTLVLLANKSFECRCDSHECEDDVTFCEMVGTILGSVSGVDVLISIYFWLCVLSLFRTMSAEETMISVF